MSKLPEAIIKHIFSYTQQCSVCKMVGTADQYKYIINWAMLWRCTRCHKLYCWNCHEPMGQLSTGVDDVKSHSDLTGHHCFSQYEWPRGKGYDNITRAEVECTREIFGD